MRRNVIDLRPEQLVTGDSPSFREWVWRCALQGHVSRPTVRAPLLFAPMPANLAWVGPCALGIAVGFCVGLYFAPSLLPSLRCPPAVVASGGTWR
jgi:hypothetical protein